MKILLAGDSFAADWQVKYPNMEGWPNMLASEHDVTNIAQAGIGEYKILKQIQNVDLDKFDTVIISHVSPNRLHCSKHPVHHNNSLHHSADLIYADLKDKEETSEDVKIAVQFFERYFDLEYQRDVANLICMEIMTTLGQFTHLNQFHLENHDSDFKYQDLPSWNWRPIFKSHRGDMNHLTSIGNRLVFERIQKYLNEIQ